MRKKFNCAFIMKTRIIKYNINIYYILYFIYLNNLCQHKYLKKTYLTISYLIY